MELRGGGVGGMPKKIGVKGGASKKNIVCKGGGMVTAKITLKCCNNNIYGGAKFSNQNALKVHFRDFSLESLLQQQIAPCLSKEGRITMGSA